MITDVQLGIAANILGIGMLLLKKPLFGKCNHKPGAQLANPERRLECPHQLTIISFDTNRPEVATLPRELILQLPFLTEAKLSRFARRLIYVRQMDFEFALWQMLYLLIQPSKVYRNFIYRKRTKDQFARDDPAFLVLLALSLVVTSIFYAVILGLSTWGFIKFILWVIFIDCFGVGIVIATALWWISNRFMRKVKDQDVEWGYCFDVHLNAFFPMLILLHVLLPIIFPTLINPGNFFSILLGNTVWFVAAAYYVYITFLGYTALPILHKTQYFLFPMSFLFIFYVATLTAGWNISKTAMRYYNERAESHRFQHNGL
ncbi:unnamed protein product [Caenorhabditis auriculariae]|uniref:Uncharacterized protein n=1 Tax=Caenorhabditis auriculariae TaxID=2777116 RepID=A0A8S1GQ98_9PELO|nr:unnamed protein product [Caenorhabditis auriculariae]